MRLGLHTKPCFFFTSTSEIPIRQQNSTQDNAMLVQVRKFERMSGSSFVKLARAKQFAPDSTRSTTKQTAQQCIMSISFFAPSWQQMAYNTNYVGQMHKARRHKQHLFQTQLRRVWARGWYRIEEMTGVNTKKWPETGTSTSITTNNLKRQEFVALNAAHGYMRINIGSADNKISLFPNLMNLAMAN